METEQDGEADSAGAFIGPEAGGAATDDSPNVAFVSGLPELPMCRWLRHALNPLL
jgi:hypothetical protein